jgi:hypothetical protein
MYVIKYERVDLEFSFVYEQAERITTKTNAIKVTDQSDTGMAIQVTTSKAGVTYPTLKLVINESDAANGAPMADACGSLTSNAARYRLALVRPAELLPEGDESDVAHDCGEAGIPARYT